MSIMLKHTAETTLMLRRLTIQYLNLEKLGSVRSTEGLENQSHLENNFIRLWLMKRLHGPLIWSHCVAWEKF